jgi:hypothetical protein
MGKKLNEPDALISLSPSPRNMPLDWSPPAPAWAVSFAEQATPVVMAYFGTQLESRDQKRLTPPMNEFFDCADPPENFENARFVDRTGCSNLITAAYWTDPASYGRWQERSGFDAWWRDPARLRDEQGHFCEILSVPPNRFETIFSHGIVVGVAKTGGPGIQRLRAAGTSGGNELSARPPGRNWLLRLTFRRGNRWQRRAFAEDVRTRLLPDSGTLGEMGIDASDDFFQIRNHGATASGRPQAEALA